MRPVGLARHARLLFPSWCGYPRSCGWEEEEDGEVDESRFHESSCEHQRCRLSRAHRRSTKRRGAGVQWMTLQMSSVGPGCFRPRAVAQPRRRNTCAIIMWWRCADLVRALFSTRDGHCLAILHRHATKMMAARLFFAAKKETKKTVVDTVSDEHACTFTFRRLKPSVPDRGNQHTPTPPS